jgi:hypothetical protein
VVDNYIVSVSENIGTDPLGGRMILIDSAAYYFNDY